MTERVRARRSHDGRRVLCGTCTEALCWRDADDGRFILRWDVAWEAKGDHLERYGWDRLAEGRGATRRGYLYTLSTVNPQRARGKFYGCDLPALCPACGALNDLDPKRLQVTPWGTG